MGAVTRVYAVALTKRYCTYGNSDDLLVPYRISRNNTIRYHDGPCVRSPSTPRHTEGGGICDASFQQIECIHSYLSKAFLKFHGKISCFLGRGVRSGMEAYI
jgi:hypothetical protein